MCAHDLEVRLAIEQRGRLEAGVLDAAPVGVPPGIEHGDVKVVVRLLEQIAHPPVRKAENRFEVASFGHLAHGHDLIAVLCPVHVGPEQAPNGMIRRQAVAGRNRQRSAASQVDPVEMADQRDVGGGRAEGDLPGEVPPGVARLARTQLAVDPRRLEPPASVIHLE